MGVSKQVFIATTVVYAIVGLALAAGGCYYGLTLKDLTDLRNYEKYQLDYTVRWPQVMPWIYVIAGLMLLLVGFCGFCGAGMKNKFFLSLHALFLAITLIILLAAGITTLTHTVGESDRFVADTVVAVFSEARISKEVLSQFEHLQSSFRCCGAVNFNDYIRDTSHFKGIPDSCCMLNETVCLSDAKLGRSVRHGCATVAANYSRRAFYFGAALCFAVAFFGLLSLAMNIVMLMKNRSKEDEHEKVKLKHVDSSSA